ncbi:uncharacterized protein N7511_003684 [Penicillium nucicola]|uniref:uncharacterized protein n=1 Tax=Penicillium nucicola TaxID=1850975 RepID=UPI0025451EA1|nr:uncharacterized protein N7511_003684 [Penicillium nucicola]KAJ5766068.1 hypothetical protein N7511_003684 [Penicillium nucicola]
MDVDLPASPWKRQVALTSILPAAQRQPKPVSSRSLKPKPRAARASPSTNGTSYHYHTFTHGSPAGGRGTTPPWHLGYASQDMVGNA